MLAEVLLIAFVYIVGITVVWRHYARSTRPRGTRRRPADGSSLTLAGMWYGYVSLPLFQFLLIRWYFRMFIWARLLWQVSRIELNLVPTHPDRVGGLGFLAATVHAFVPLLMAHGALLAGQLANQIFHLGASLTRVQARDSAAGDLHGVHGRGPAAGVHAPAGAARSERGCASTARWRSGTSANSTPSGCAAAARADERLLGSGDIQSLADLGNSFEVVAGMRVVPVTKEAMFQLAMATVAPVVPLLLTMMPLEELLQKLFGILF